MTIAECAVQLVIDNWPSRNAKRCISNIFVLFCFSVVKVAPKWGQLCPRAFQIVFPNFNSFRCKRVRRAWIPISDLWSQKIFRRNAVWICLIQSDPIAKLADRSWIPSDQTCAWPKKTEAKLHRIRPQNGLRGSRIPTMEFRPRESPFFGDYFFRFGPIVFKFSHTSFQPKRRFLSIWSVNKKSIIRVLVIAS